MIDDMIPTYIIILLFFLSQQIAALPSIKRAPCTVFSEGYEAIDDAPAINNAIKECGQGGIIILPAGQIFSVRTTIDFSSCRDCDVQLEGKILIASDWGAWNNTSGFISISGANGVKFRSLTGKGLIDGNAKAFYGRGRTTPSAYAEAIPVLVPIIESSNILVDGLTIINPAKQFFRTEGQSSHIRFSNLTLIVEDQWRDDIWTKLESIGFQFRNSSNIELDGISVDFRSVQASAQVGVCAAIDYSTSDISINNITCNNTSDGVLMQFGSLGERGAPPAEVQWSKNIRISNYTANSHDNSGFKHMVGHDYSKVTNLTYDGVNIVAGNTLINMNCYLVQRSWTAACSPGPNGLIYHLQADFEDIWFKNYRGRVSKPTLECSQNSTCDFHFEGWPTQD